MNKGFISVWNGVTALLLTTLRFPLTPVVSAAPSSGFKE